jgi:hypothetical protein
MHHHTRRRRLAALAATAALVAIPLGCGGNDSGSVTPGPDAARASEDAAPDFQRWTCDLWLQWPDDLRQEFLDGYLDSWRERVPDALLDLGELNARAERCRDLPPDTPIITVLL